MPDYDYTTLQEFLSREVLSPEHRNLPGSDDIVRTAYRLLMGWLGGSHQDAEDVLSRTVMDFLDAYDRLANVGGIKSPRALFFSIARRRCVDLLRHMNSSHKPIAFESLGSDAIDRLQDDTESGYEQIVREETRATVQEALNRVIGDMQDDFHKQVVTMYYVDCIDSPSEIATELGVKAGHVRVILHRTREKLAKALNSSLTNPFS